MKGGMMNKCFLDLPILIEHVGVDYIICAARDAMTEDDLFFIESMKYDRQMIANTFGIPEQYIIRFNAGDLKVWPDNNIIAP